MSNSENTKFKDLTLEEQLELVTYVLQGNTLSSRRSECENFLEVVNDKPTVLTFKWDHMFKKNPSRLENLIKQKEALEKEIAALQASHNSYLVEDNPLGTQSPSEGEKASENAFVGEDECGERITLGNWRYLSLEVGDEVYIKLSGDEDFESDSSHAISKLYQDEVGHREECFLKLSDKWYDYDISVENELYLIRTPEGSLHDN